MDSAPAPTYVYEDFIHTDRNWEKKIQHSLILKVELFKTLKNLKKENLKETESLIF